MLGLVLQEELALVRAGGVVRLVHAGGQSTVDLLGFLLGRVQAGRLFGRLLRRLFAIFHILGGCVRPHVFAVDLLGFGAFVLDWLLSGGLLGLGSLLDGLLLLWLCLLVRLIVLCLGGGAGLRRLALLTSLVERNLNIEGLLGGLVGLEAFLVVRAELGGDLLLGSSVVLFSELSVLGLLSLGLFLLGDLLLLDWRLLRIDDLGRLLLLEVLGHCGRAERLLLGLLVLER